MKLKFKIMKSTKEKTYNSGYKALDKLFKYFDEHPHAIEGVAFSVVAIVFIILLTVFKLVI